MKGIMSGVLLNLILAPLLIIYFALGITGAAIATLISQCFGCAMLFWMSHKGQNIRIHLHNFTPTRAYIKEIIFGGTPSLSRQGLGSIATLVLNVAAGAYGDAAIAGMSSGARMRLRSTPDMIPFIAYIALPWKRIWLLRVREVVMKGAPSRMMPR
jgi:Na+-driven multidrug efflux pump